MLLQCVNSGYISLIQELYPSTEGELTLHTATSMKDSDVIRQCSATSDYYSMAGSRYSSEDLGSPITEQVPLLVPSSSQHRSDQTTKSDLVRQNALPSVSDLTDIAENTESAQN